MTIITNHRITARNKAHKAHTPSHRRLPLKNSVRFNKKRGSTLQILMALPEMKAALLPPPTPLLAPSPSAPPAIMHMRVVHVWDMEYHVHLPHDMDIYEGLRRWYPDLYQAVLEEEMMIRGEPSTPKLTEEEVDDAWAKYDYLEWLSD